MYSKIVSQSNGIAKLEKEAAVVESGCSLDGIRAVFGTGTPICSAKALLKNFSSALHQNGLLITAVPVIAAFFKLAR